MPNANGTSSQQNPSHILIARSSTSLSPTETLTTPATASGFLPRSSIKSGVNASPPWVLHEVSLGSSGEEGLESTEGEDGSTSPIELDETFLGASGSRWPGTIKIVVEATTFWAHKEILVFASPFFDAALSGSWSETNARPVSMSSIITIQQTPMVHGELPTAFEETEPAVTITPVAEEISLNPNVNDSSEGEGEDIAIRVSLSSERNSPTEAPVVIHSSSSSREGGDEDDGDEEQNKTPSPSSTNPFSEIDEAEREAARVSSLEKLQGKSAFSLPPSSRGPGNKSPKKKIRRRSRIPEGIIILKEERATIFHDFLKFVYPHLECTITWKNVEGLMNLSDKLCVPSLQKACLEFLLSHAAGKPIKAMRIAEIFGHEELYRESSRFVLDNPHGWSEEEMNTLSKDTLLKLEKRRNWFLERVLKLGTVSIAKEYQCCATCPDPGACAKMLEDRWRAGYHALFRFGPAQPSMVFRYLRSLEGVSPPLALTHLACQSHAKTWVEHLFDRMFSLGVRGSGVDAPPLTARAAGAAAPLGAKRHFLYCSLKPEVPPGKGAAKIAMSGSKDKLVRGSGLVRNLD
ncbi:hypothetical protein CPB86DRAFT_701424 [Serendipita vermifera]|nr:hypothetical protein CPB86DRAFT_701424 [Serendipita vermifera]